MRIVNSGLYVLMILGCSGMLLAGAFHHPFAPWWPATLVAAWALLMWLAPGWWIALFLGLLPVLDLTPFSGWLFVEDFDFVTLTTLMVGYTRMLLAPRLSGLAKSRAGMRVTVVLGALLIAAYCTALAASAAIGILPLAPLDANAFSNYFSRYNALRLAKAPLVALALMPLIFYQYRSQPAATRKLVGIGMVAGLAFAGICVVWERLAFLSLTDLASDYRVTGFFSGTHTGGAALDAYLAMTLPFAIAALLCARGTLHFALSATTLLLGCYGVLVTFSRTLYVAVALCVTLQLVMFGWTYRSGASQQVAGRKLGSLLFALALGGGLFWSFGLVFSSAGYRGLAALGGCVLAVYLLSATPMRMARRSLITILLLGAASGATALLVPKGAYLAYGANLIAMAAILAGAPVLRQRHGWACFAGLTFNAIGVCAFWGGQPALIDGLVVLGAVWLLAIFNASWDQRLWRVSPASMPVVLLGAIAIAAGVVVTHTYRSTERLATVEQDLAGRMQHWRAVAGAMDQDARAQSLGMGLGRMPETYFWRNGTADLTGSFTFVSEAENQFLRLIGPRFRIGYGDPLRLLQAVNPAAPVVKITLLARTTKKAGLQIAICARHLIYNAACEGTSLTLPADGAWHPHTVRLDIARVMAGSPGVPRPLFLVLMSETQKSLVDIDDVAIEDPYGRGFIRNGNFTNGMDHWFFSSDREHLSWHAKSLFLHTYFEQGLVGLALLLGLLAMAFLRLWRPVLAGDAGAAALAAALAGFVLVGLFDSLVDVPRVALVFYLFLFGTLLAPRSLLFPRLLLRETGRPDAGPPSRDKQP